MSAKLKDICVLFPGGRVKQSCFPDIELVGIGQPADAPFHSPPCSTDPTIAHYTFHERECKIIIVIKPKHHIIVFSINVTSYVKWHENIILREPAKLMSNIYIDINKGFPLI